MFADRMISNIVFIVAALLLLSDTSAYRNYHSSLLTARSKITTTSTRPCKSSMTEVGEDKQLGPLTSSPENESTTSDDRARSLDMDFSKGSPVVWKASVTSSVKVQEVNRTVEDYLALPASQYSVLAAEQVIRLSDSDFKVVLGTLNFFGTKITPILYVTVNVIPEEPRAEIIVDRAETTGSDVADAINGTFSISAVNKVTCGRDKKGRKTLQSATELEINALVPKSKIAVGMLKTGGNFVLQSSLNIIVPTFIRILSSDFKRWSAGSDERDALEGASLDLQ